MNNFVFSPKHTAFNQSFVLLFDCFFDRTLPFSQLQQLLGEIIGVLSGLYKVAIHHY